MAGVDDPDVDVDGDDPDVDVDGVVAKRRTTLAGADDVGTGTVPAGEPVAVERGSAGRVAGPVGAAVFAGPPAGSGRPDGRGADRELVACVPPACVGPPACAAAVVVGRVAGAARPGSVARPGWAGRSIRVTRGATGSRAADRTRAATDRRMKRPDHHRLPVTSSPVGSSVAGSPAGRGVFAGAGHGGEPRFSGRTPSGTERGSVLGPGAANSGAAAVLAGFGALAGAAVRQEPDHRRRRTETTGVADDVACSVPVLGTTGRATDAVLVRWSTTGAVRPGTAAGRARRLAPAGATVPMRTDRSGCPEADAPTGIGPAGPGSVGPEPVRAGSTTLPSVRGPAHRRRSARVCRVQPTGAGAPAREAPAVRRMVLAGSEPGAGVGRAPVLVVVVGLAE